MRAREFLLEYRRDITVNRFRDGLHKKIIDEFDFERLHLDDLGDPEKINAYMTDRINTYMNYIEERDPSPNKQYVEWLTRMWIKDPQQKLEDLNRNDLLGIYHRGKNIGVVPAELRDIGRFKTYRDFEDAMLAPRPEDSIVDRYWSYHGEDSKKKLGRGESKEVYRDDTVRVIVPQNEEAACYYGQGTRWCTAATSGRNYFDHYSQQGPLYIVIPAKPSYSGEKYQLHFPSGQFMDEEDKSTDITELLDDFPGFKKYLLTNEPKLKEYMIFADRDDIEELSDRAKGKILYHIESIMNNAQRSDNFYEWQLEGAQDLGFVDEDGDPDWDRIANEPQLQFSAYDPAAAELAQEMINQIQLTTPETIIDIVGELQNDEDGMVTFDSHGIREVYSYMLNPSESDHYRDTRTVEKLKNVSSWIMNSSSLLWRGIDPER